LEGIKKRFPSEEDFYRQLQKENLTAHKLKKNLEKQLLIQKLIRREVIGRVSVTPDEVEEKLSEGNFSDENSYRLSEIFRKEKKEIEKILSSSDKGLKSVDNLNVSNIFICQKTSIKVAKLIHIIITCWIANKL